MKALRTTRARARRARVLCVMTVIVVACLGATVRPWSETPLRDRDNVSEPAARVRVQLVTTPPDTATGSSALAEFQPVLKAGESRTGFLESGGPTMGLCDLAAIPSSAKFTLAYRWQADVQVQSVGPDQVVFDLAWRRLDTRRDLGERRVLTLKPGEEHLLDFVADSAGTCARNAVLKVSVDIVAPVHREDGVLMYDVWWVDQSEQGRERTRHWQSAALPGETAAFRFKPFRWTLDQQETEEPAADRLVRVAVSGSLRARIRADNTLEMALYTRRDVFDGVGSSGSFGDKLIVIRPGESVAFDLPDYPAPQIGKVAQTGPGPIIMHLGESTRVNFFRFFAGHKSRLIVTVRTSQ